MAKMPFEDCDPWKGSNSLICPNRKKNDDHLQKVFISYWFKLLSKIEETGPFF